MQCVSVNAVKLCSGADFLHRVGADVQCTQSRCAMYTLINVLMKNVKQCSGAVLHLRYIYFALGRRRCAMYTQLMQILRLLSAG